MYIVHFSLLALWVTMCMSVDAQSNQQQSASSGSAPLSRYHEKWLDEDVVYIITPEERRAFERASGDEEREQLIEAFWRRRDTNPDTEQNEFRDEHEWRIAHVNGVFACNIPGWRTGRGRIYITIGKPDEVRTFPAGDDKTPSPLELWVYKREPGTEWIYEFVDDAGTGCFPGGRPTNR